MLTTINSGKNEEWDPYFFWLAYEKTKSGLNKVIKFILHDGSTMNAYDRSFEMNDDSGMT